MVFTTLPTANVAGSGPFSRDRAHVESDEHADSEGNGRVFSVGKVTDSARVLDETPTLRGIKASDNAFCLLGRIDAMHGDPTFRKRLDPNILPEDGSRTSGDTTVKSGGVKPPLILAVRDIPEGAIRIEVRHEGARQAFRIASRS